ncbi:Dynamin N-terminal domain-containing protein [Gammaproteobacteria bacterium]
MSNERFENKLSAFSQWKADAVHAIGLLSIWLEQQGMQSPENTRRIQQALDTLRQEQLTIAFVAELSRGKTELINAIFLADYGRRLLPSTAGRTTMCPTEIFWDQDVGRAYLRLLPIETRSRDDSLTALKQQTDPWVEWPLDINQPEQMEDRLREVMRTKTVSLDEAKRLGLYNPDLDALRGRAELSVEIPVWRHALISLPHPLLRQGLRILDTPGLNALGAEPELTFSLLPSAQAVLFLLAADTGVTRSDLEMWQHHVGTSQGGRKNGILVVLNKIDALWDGFRSTREMLNAIDRQKALTSQTLGVDERAIFAVSAQKAWLAKSRHDESLLIRSGILALEQYLANDLMNARQRLIMARIAGDIGQLLESARGLVNARFNDSKRQLEELEQLSGKSEDVINKCLEETRAKQIRYLQSIAQFQESREDLRVQEKLLRRAIDQAHLRATIAASETQMRASWTTHGLMRVMKQLFDHIRNRMQVIATQSERTRKLVHIIYVKFQTDFGFSVTEPKLPPIMKHRVALEQLQEEFEVFRSSPITAMMEQNYLIKRFFQTLVAEAQTLFDQARMDVEGWLNGALEPLLLQIQDHKEQTEARLQDFQKISRSKATLQGRIDTLRENHQTLSRQLAQLHKIDQTIRHTLP